MDASAGVRSTVATPILLKELEAQPFQDDWWHRAVRFWKKLASLPVTTIYKHIALDACQVAVTRNVPNWACSVIEGVRALGYDLVTSATDMTHINVPKFTQVLADRILPCGKTLISVLGPAHSTSLVCVLTMHGMLAWRFC